MSRPVYGQGIDGTVPIYGRMMLDLVGGVAGVWRVCMNERRIISAVQKEGSKTWFEVFDFGGEDAGLGTHVNGTGDTLMQRHNEEEDDEDDDEGDYDGEYDMEDDEGLDDEEGDHMEEDGRLEQVPPSAPLMRTLSLPPFGTGNNLGGAGMGGGPTNGGGGPNQMFPPGHLFQ